MSDHLYVEILAKGNDQEGFWSSPKPPFLATRSRSHARKKRLMQPHLLILPNNFQIRTLFWIARWRTLPCRPARENRLRSPVNLSLQSLSFPFVPVPHFVIPGSLTFFGSFHLSRDRATSPSTSFQVVLTVLFYAPRNVSTRLDSRAGLRPFCFDVRAIPWIFFNRIFGIIYYPNGKLGRVFIIFHDIFPVSSSHIQSHLELMNKIQLT